MEQISSWVAPIATTIAALMTASNLGSRITGYGFIVFTVGSLAWLVLGIATDQPNLLWQNVILTGLNLFGIWRWLGRQARIEDGGKAAREKSQDTPGEALFPASLLNRAKLAGAGDHELGACVDAMIGARSGGIAYVVAADGGMAGVGETLRRVDWRNCRVEEDKLIIGLDPSGFGRLPALPKDEWPGR
ncbi:MAG: PRC-barrel domain containing protein [Sphingomonas sp.]|uniref:PRC-barrel domain containing protein n=1 Tax=Sphingomonas sp. TaxID=28214 RepID=UPI0018549EEC|nr:PRC-barrel domain containing protein [Sphingomonas sp.]MBA3667932.1 PRC-barrel domain containing protein [Sphingomonas sp.]